LDDGAKMPVNSGDTMFNVTGLSSSPICPKCRRQASLRLSASLSETDGFPRLECLECSACGEVLLVERGLGERSDVAGDIAVRVAA
jgi:hypothetical protein